MLTTETTHCVTTETGAQTCVRLMREFIELHQHYTPEYMQKLCQMAESHRGLFAMAPPQQLLDDIKATDRMKELPGLIDGHLLARKLEPLGMEVVDLAIQVNAMARNQFSHPTGEFLASQLFMLEGTTMTPEEACAYVQAKCDEFAPGEGYLAKVANCEHCGGITLVVNNEHFRSKPQQRESGMSVEVIDIVIPVDSGRPRRGGLFGGFPFNIGRD